MIRTRGRSLFAPVKGRKGMTTDQVLRAQQTRSTTGASSSGAAERCWAKGAFGVLDVERATLRPLAVSSAAVVLRRAEQLQEVPRSGCGGTFRRLDPRSSLHRHKKGTSMAAHDSFPTFGPCYATPSLGPKLAPLAPSRRELCYAGVSSTTQASCWLVTRSTEPPENVTL